MLLKFAIQKAFTVIFEERVQKFAWYKAKQNDDYTKAEKNQIMAFQLLNESLTKEQRQLLREFESACHLVDGIMQEYAYRQGLEDSQMIRKELCELSFYITNDNQDHN